MTRLKRTMKNLDISRREAKKRIKADNKLQYECYISAKRIFNNLHGDKK